MPFSRSVAKSKKQRSPLFEMTMPRTSWTSLPLSRVRHRTCNVILRYHALLTFTAVYNSIEKTPTCVGHAKFGDWIDTIEVFGAMARDFPLFYAVSTFCNEVLVPSRQQNLGDTGGSCEWRWNGNPESSEHVFEFKDCPAQILRLLGLVLLKRIRGCKRLGIKQLFLIFYFVV